jgi:hypothetical protein
MSSSIMHPLHDSIHCKFLSLLPHVLQVLMQCYQLAVVHTCLSNF